MPFSAQTRQGGYKTPSGKRIGFPAKMRKIGNNDLELLEALFEQLPGSPFFIKDRDLRYVAANPAMAELCGVRRPRDLYGKCVGDFFPEALAQSYEELDREVIASGRPVTDVLQRSVEGGRADAWLLFSRMPVRDADGSCVGVAGTSRRLRPGLVGEGSFARLQQVTRRLRSEFDRPLRLGELARQAGSSPSQLERDFRRIFAMSPRDFLQRLRMQHARRLLEETGVSVSAIAQECGYADQSAFTRRFAADIGATPTKYRQLKRKAACRGPPGSS